MLARLGRAALVVMLIIGSGAAAQSPAQEPVVARVTITAPADLLRFIALGLDILEMRDGNDLFVLTTSTEADRLRACCLEIPSSAAYRLGMPPFDPIASPTVRLAPHREPAFVFPDEAEAARQKLAVDEARTGRRPNILVILFDDMGWGDFGCYGTACATTSPPSRPIRPSG